MSKDKRLDAVARAVTTVGPKGISTKLSPGALANLSKAAAATTVAQDKAALRARRDAGK